MPGIAIHTPEPLEADHRLVTATPRTQPSVAATEAERASPFDTGVGCGTGAPVPPETPLCGGWYGSHPPEVTGGAGSVCVERFEDYPQLGRFTLRDQGQTIAIGKITRLITDLAEVKKEDAAAAAGG